MNTLLNALARTLARAVSSRRWGRVLIVVVVLAMAGLGLLPRLDGQADAADQGSHAAGRDNGAGRAPEAGGSAVTAPAGGYLLQGKVVRVADGDTFTILVQGRQARIRMASIDAPEVTKDSARPGQPYAQASRDALAAMLSGKTVTLRCYERDRYDRNVCDVPLPGGGSANRRQVEAGMAWANMEGRGKFMRDDALPGLEQRARDQQLGVWRDRDPVRPWVWRYQCWQKHQC